MRVPLIAGICLVLFIPNISRSQEPLTWDECVKRTAENNRDFKASLAALQASSAQYKSSYSSFLPSVSASAGYRRSGSDSISKNIDDSYSMGVSASQDIFSGFKNKAELDQSKAEYSAALIDQVITVAQITYLLRQAFTDLLYAQELMRLTKTIAERLKNNAELVELKYEMGAENKGSYLKSKADYMQGMFEVNQAERALASKQITLAAIMGTDDFKVLTATGSFTSPVAEPLPDFKVLAKSIPTYRKSSAQVQARKASLISARGSLYPSLTAQGSLSRSGDTWPPEERGWSAGGSLSLPIFTGGRNINAVKSADASYRQALLTMESTYLDNISELESTYRAFIDAQENVQVKKAYREAADVRAEIAYSQYTKGLISFEDWDKIQNELITNEKGMLSSEREVLIAEANWGKILGKGGLP